MRLLRLTETHFNKCLQNFGKGGGWSVLEQFNLDERTTGFSFVRINGWAPKCLRDC